MMKNLLMVFALSYISVSSVQAGLVSWDIQFFDATGVQVGNGSMSYDPDTTYAYTYPTHDEFICPDPDSLPCGYIPVENTYETNYSFSSFDFNILDANWSVSSEGTQWWNGSANHYGGAERYGGYNFQPLPFFFLGENYLSVHYLSLNFHDSNPEGITTTTGFWTQHLSGDYAPSGGEWIANRTSAVPIPSAILLLGSGLVSLIMLGRKPRI